MAEKIRLQVFLSRNGVCSRRAALDLVKNGSVRVNGSVQIEPSFLVDPVNDQVDVDGTNVIAQNLEYVMFHKPQGYVTTKANQGAQKNIYNVLPSGNDHLLPVGRLDKDTEGLLLLTNDGDLSFALTHPKFHVDKTYYVIAKGDVDAMTVSLLENGVVIESGMTAPAKITEVKPHKNDTELKITIHEGKKRQIRLMFEEVGHRVKYLKRLTQGPLQLGTLPVGKTRPLEEEEIKLLMKIKSEVMSKNND